MFIDRPTNLLARAQTFSNYKHHNTAKVLIGITPQGFICFVSEAWRGRTSDKYLTYDINSNLSMYADDHQIYEIGENLHTVNCKLNENAAKASYWYESNLLKGNLAKYQTMTIRNKQGSDSVCVNVQGNDIESSDSLKLLGVTIDSKMNFNDHINIVSRKASQRVGVIMRLRKLIPTEAKLQLYKTAILPHLTYYHLMYCHLIWHFCKANDTRKLERIQESGLRAVFKDKQSTYQQLLERAALPTYMSV